AHARLKIRGLERDHLFLESNARDLHGNPRPKRPRGIVLVANDELERHAPPSRRCCAVSGDGEGSRRRRSSGSAPGARSDPTASITAVMAAPRTAAVATTTVTAAANHRRARSRGVARGKVQGIAGSMRIVDAPTQALGRRNIRATGQTARDSNRWPAKAVAQR